MKNETEVNYFKSLVTPKAEKPKDRSLWSMPLNAVIIPFYTGQNVIGNTFISAEALGHPIRLNQDKDGNVRFNSKGMPTYGVCKELRTAVNALRDNIIGRMLKETDRIKDGAETSQAYIEAVKASVKAGKPLKALEVVKLAQAIEARSQSESENVVTDEAEVKQPELAIAGK